MNEQLYRLIFSRFMKLSVLAIFSILLASCGEDSMQEQKASSQVQNEQVETTSTQQTETAATMGSEVAEEIASEAAEVDVPANDAGFLNYDMVIGNPDAPVEIIEYASITCNHCATFHNNVLPRIKDKYVDSGQVKIVTRSFLLNAIDVQGTAISRCVPEQRYFRFMDAIFERQTQWYDLNEYDRLQSLHNIQTANQMFISHSVGELSKIARQLGLNQAKIDECIASEEIGEYIISVYNEGVERHKVEATPTILVNGNKTGNDYGSVERAIEAALD